MLSIDSRTWKSEKDINLENLPTEGRQGASHDARACNGRADVEITKRLLGGLVVVLSSTRSKV